MSRDSRFDQLEQQILAGLRAADGPEPSISLDLRIRAQAQAAVAKPAQTQARRVQPRWMSIAAGLVVLVGTGLAIRVSQQVAREPNVLDAPASAESAASPAPPAQPKQETRADQAVGQLGDSSNAPQAAAKPATTAGRSDRAEAEMPSVRESALPPPALKAREMPNAFPRGDEARATDAQRYDAPAETRYEPAPVVAAPAAEPESAPASMSGVAKQPSRVANEAPIYETDAVAADSARPADAGAAPSPASPVPPPPRSAPMAEMLSAPDDAPAAARIRAATESSSEIARDHASIASPESASSAMAGARQQADAPAREPKKLGEVVASLSLEDGIEHVRAALAAGDRKQAILEAKALRKAFPRDLLPTDVQQLLDE